MPSVQPIPFSVPPGDPDAPCLRRLRGACDLLQVHKLAPDRYPFLLESAASGTPQARYDILFAFPGETLELPARGGMTGGMGPTGRADFLATFDTWWQHEQIKEAAESALPPFRGGWFVFIGYELAREIEPTLDLAAAPGSLPVAFATRVPAAVIHDRVRNEIVLVAEAGGEDLLAELAADLERARATAPRADYEPCLEGYLEEEEPERYLEGVRRVIDYVLAGDVFQVNLSRLWQGRLKPKTRHCELYDRLRRRNPSPFAGLVRMGNRSIISSSPERLVKVSGRLVQTRPIAGTRPRGSSGLTDVALSEELIAHPKERAEHIMLVDLERNDLSRVCVPGSVKVSERMVIESYAQVHHIVSNIEGQLYEDVNPGDVLRAIFPGGTITGCPKVRCMEIIAELEQVGRGAYTGSMGYINRDGSMDLNILIRTIVAEGDEISLRAGAGIVADSIPERELEETQAKARALVMALVTES
ncbi:MAG: aminodeoxychorismate synthase component I [Alphaproteobacteria bacterium]